MDYKNLIKFFFESNQLTKIKRSGDFLANNPSPESIADHNFRAMIIGYILAKLEKADENKVLKTLLFHSIHETRILNLHRVASRYINTKQAEKLAFEDQLSYFSEDIKKELEQLKNEYEKESTKEAEIASDAKCLANSVAAKEAIEKGIDMSIWIENDEKALKTDSAKNLIKELKSTNSNEWWKNLKYIPKMDLGEKKFK